MCVFIFSKTFVWNISHSSKNWERYDKKMYINLHIKYTLFSSGFNATWIFSTDFLKMLEYQISWKSVQWKPSCSMRTDGQTGRRRGMMEQIVSLRKRLKSIYWVVATCALMVITKAHICSPNTWRQFAPPPPPPPETMVTTYSCTVAYFWRTKIWVQRPLPQPRKYYYRSLLISSSISPIYLGVEYYEFETCRLNTKWRLKNYAAL